jgi:hypothetical protein
MILRLLQPEKLNSNYERKSKTAISIPEICTVIEGLQQRLSQLSKEQDDVVKKLGEAIEEIRNLRAKLAS